MVSGDASPEPGKVTRVWRVAGRWLSPWPGSEGPSQLLRLAVPWGRGLWSWEPGGISVHLWAVHPRPSCHHLPLQGEGHQVCCAWT